MKKPSYHLRSGTVVARRHGSEMRTTPTESWSGCRDLNPGPLAPQASDRHGVAGVLDASTAVTLSHCGPLVAHAEGSGTKLEVAKSQGGPVRRVNAGGPVHYPGPTNIRGRCKRPRVQHKEQHVKKLLALCILALVLAAAVQACTDSPFFCPEDFNPSSGGGGTSSCGWFTCEDIPDPPAPPPPPPPACGYGGSCQ